MLIQYGNTVNFTVSLLKGIDFMQRFKMKINFEDNRRACKPEANLVV